MSYQLSLWRRRSGAVSSSARIYALLSEDVEVSDIEALDIDRLAEEIDGAFPGWRSSEAAFECQLEPRAIMLQFYGSADESLFAWFFDFGRRHGLTVFDPQSDEVPKADLEYARRLAEEIRQRELTRRWPDQVRHLMTDAGAGDPRAECELGDRYFFGEGVSRDLEEAFRWYSLSAAHGFVDGMFNLAGCYYRGQGTQRDVALAIEWYSNAAAEDQTYATFALGEIYLSGEGIARDNEQARRYFSIAFEHGHPDAKAAIRMCDEPIVTAEMKRRAWKFWSR